MTLKKVLSVFLAFVMLVCVSSTGLVGLAAGVNYEAQYSALADALKNEYVRELANYTVQSSTLDDVNEGFNSEANGFAYEHRVIAADNTAGDILRAANIFYYIAEGLISTTYGIGCYDASLLVAQISDKLKKDWFSGDSAVFYEDFYGKRYYPTDEELAAYNEAVAQIEAEGGTVSQTALTALDIRFIKRDAYEYYNIDTVLRYFVGNTLKINAGNWYHRYVFVVQTSPDTILIESGGIDNISNNIAIRTGVYELDYTRTFDETGTKAHYAFIAPSLETVWRNYGAEYKFGASSVSDNLANSYNGLTKTGQAKNFFLRVTNDTTTVPYLKNIYSMYIGYISDANWDKAFADKSDARIAADIPNASAMVEGMEYMTSAFSNEALLTMFGEDIGNMMTLTYILKPISTSPSRTVRGAAKYTASADKLNDIIHDLDALVYSDMDPDNPALTPEQQNNAKTSRRVSTIVKQFFDTTNSLFEGTSVYGMEFDTLNELVKHLVTGLLFTDSIVNTLVELLYPLVVGLIVDNVVKPVSDAVGSGLGGTVSDLLNSILTQNDLAIYPDDLADRIDADYKGQFTNATAVLRSFGHDWANANYEALNWGVDDAEYENKAEQFTSALCASLGGFVRLLVTLMCGDAQWTENIDNDKGLPYDKDEFNEYLDKDVIQFGTLHGVLRSQGGYTKLIVPLFRVLGVPEMPRGVQPGTKLTGYVTSEDYHRITISKDEKGVYRYGYSLRLIVEPLVYWIEHILAEKPFETLMTLIPNLINFFVRVDTAPGAFKEEYATEWHKNDVVDTAHGWNDGFNTYEALGRCNLLTILNHIFIDITIDGWLIHANIDSIGSLGELIDQDTLLGSVNGLLDELLSLEYDRETGDLATVAYTNGTAIVLADSDEYAANPSAYPTPLQMVYADAEKATFTAEKDDTHTKLIKQPVTVKETYKIPQLQEAKFTSVSAVNPDGSMVEPNAIGVLKREWNTIDVRNPGVVFMYLLRFVLSAVGYKYDSSYKFEGVVTDENGDVVYDDGVALTKSYPMPYLINCFGLDTDSELFAGLKLSDIIYNVMLHPDEAICALLELFYSNENGSYYNNISYTYSITPINYHNFVLLDDQINPTLSYGTQVKYSQYWTREYADETLTNLEDLANTILPMIGIEGFENGLSGFLKNLLNENVFNNKLMNTLFNTIYQLLGGLNDTVGFDIAAILDAALDVTYSTESVGRTLKAMAGESEASRAISRAESWQEIFGITEENPEPTDVEYNWGIDDAEKPHYAFLKTAAALLSPAAFVFRFLFMDMHLDLLGLININGYAGYQYAFIALLEMLSCPPEAIKTYREYYELGQQNSGAEKLGDANVIYYLLSPLLGLIDKVYEDPLTTLLGLIPNLLFFISIGGLNDLLNNLVHFAYVLLDILKPILNGYDLLGDLLANIEISGIKLSLSLPLNIDFNALISELLDGLVGDSLTIEGVKISLPYIDFHTLCCGTLTSVFSREQRNIVRLNSANGGDLITAILRLAIEILYMEDNQKAVSELLSNLIGENEDGTPKLDDLDRYTMLSLLKEILGLVDEFQVLDLVLFVVYFLVSKLTPIVGTLGERLAASGMTVTELFADFDINNLGAFIEKVSVLLKDPVPEGGETEPQPPAEEVPIPQAATSLLDRIKAFFAKIAAFFKSLFSFA